MFFPQLLKFILEAMALKEWKTLSIKFLQGESEGMRKISHF